MSSPAWARGWGPDAWEAVEAYEDAWRNWSALRHDDERGDEDDYDTRVEREMEVRRA